MYIKKTNQTQRYFYYFKRAAILLVIAAVSLTAQAQTPQSKTIQLSGKNMSVSDVFKAIHSQTGLNLTYDQTFDASRRVTFTSTSMTVEEVMNTVLRGTNRGYTISGSFIIVKQPEAPKSVVAQKPQAPVADNGKKQPQTKPESIQGVMIPTHTKRIGFEPEPIIVPEPLGNYQSVANLRKTPGFALKTNLLLDATASISLGAEFKLGRKFTLDLPFTHNSWSTSGDRKWKNFTVQPGLRWWTCEAFNGHFLGIHAHYARFNVGNLPSPFSQTMRDYRFEGELYGAGLNYGYQWILGKRWAMEAEIGAGWAHLWGKKYQCGDCGRPVGEFKKDYFGPTKAGFSLIYIIK